MVGPLVRDAALHGVVPAALTVGAVYAATAAVGSSFGPLALGMLLVGLFFGSLMFARAGTGTGTMVGGEGSSAGEITGATEPDATHYVVVGGDTPIRFRLGVYLLAVALFSAVGLAIIL